MMGAEQDGTPQEGGTTPAPMGADPAKPHGPGTQSGAHGDNPPDSPALGPEDAIRMATTAAQARRVKANLDRDRAKARKANADAELAELKVQTARERAKAAAEGRPPPLPASVASLPAEGVEKCRAALQVAVRGGKPFTTWTQLRKAAAVDTATANPVWAAYKAGLMPPLEAPWVAGQVPTGRVLPKGKKAELLMARIRGAKTPGEVAAVTAEVTALQVSGELDRTTAAGILEGCAEMRKGMADMQKRHDPLATPDDRRMCLCSAEAAEAAKSIDHLDDDRKEMVFAFIGEMLEQENAAARERAPVDAEETP